MKKYLLAGVFAALTACGGATSESTEGQGHAKDGHEHADGHGHDHDGKGHDHGKDGHDHAEKGDGHAEKGDAHGDEKKAPEGRVFFESPKDGAQVKSPVKIVMGIEGMEVKAAGTLEEGTGHHHIVIGPAGIEQGQQVPKDETHIHFGKGQTEAEIELKPGKHKLTMQFADGNHISYGEGMATTITIEVVE